MKTLKEKLSAALKPNLANGIIFAAGLTLGVFAVIAFQAFSPQNEHPTHDIAQSRGQHSSTKGADGTSNKSTIEVGKFLEIFKHRNVFEQNNALYSTLSSASVGELRNWWIQSQKIEQRSHREIAQDAILRHLTVKNPQEAFRYLEDISIFESDTLLRTVFSEWSISQLDEAIEVATTLSVPRRKVALQSILETRDDLSEDERRAIAKQLEGEDIYLKLVSDTKASESIAEPKKSWEILLNDDVDDYLQTESLIKVAEAWRKQVGFEVLSNIYADIEDYRSKLQLVSVITQADLAGAFNYTLGLSEASEREYIAGDIVREWARKDAQAALGAVRTIEDSSLASTLEDQIATTWAISNPIEAIENIAVISEQFRLFTLELAFMQVASQNPLEAIAMVSSVENFVGNTTTIVKSVVRVWSRQKPDAATDWILNNYTLEDPQRRKLLEEVLPLLALQNPYQAFEIAIEQPTPSTGFGLELGVIFRIVRDGNIELAKKFLPQVKQNTKANAYSVVGTAMVRELETTEAIELGTDLSGRDQQRYYERVLSAWASTSPKDLYESLENFSTNKLQSSAAMQLITHNPRQPILTDEQIKHARSFLDSDDESTVIRIENR